MRELACSTRTRSIRTWYYVIIITTTITVIVIRRTYGKRRTRERGSVNVTKDTVSVVGCQMSFVLGNERSQYVLHQHLEAQLFLGTQFLENRTRLRAGFEITCKNRRSSLLHVQ